jgi:hypothetical protein
MKTESRNESFVDRSGHPLEFWAFLLNGHLIGLTYTTFPQWTVKHVEFAL